MSDLLLASLIINFILVFILFLFISVASPVFPFIKAKLTGKDLVIIFQGNDRLALKPGKFSAVILAKDKAWIPRKKKTWNWKGVQTWVLYDGVGITFDPEMELAIKALEEKKGIKSWEELTERLKATQSVKARLFELMNKKETVKESEKQKIEKEIAELDNWIKTYGIDEREPLVYRTFGVISVKDVVHYFGDVYPSEIKAHIDENIVLLAKQYLNPITRIFPWIIIFIMILVGGGIAYNLFATPHTTQIPLSTPTPTPPPTPAGVM